MNITLIAAMGKNQEIGEKNALLWNLPLDMQHFRKRTKKKAVIMGRKTYESIGHPLPNRKNIVLSENQDLKIEGVDVRDDIHEVLKELEAEGKKDVMIIGGSSIYEYMLPIATHLSLSYVDAEFPNADSFFPKFNEQQFFVLSEEIFPADSENKYSFTIREFERM